jgi:16S rRNA processing protein RimM
MRSERPPAKSSSKSPFAALPGRGLTDSEVELGHISGVFGLRGEVRLFLHNQKSQTLARELPVVLVDRDGNRFAARLQARSGAGKRVLGRIPGIDGPEAARELMGLVIGIAKELLPKPAAGEFYVHELEGMRVIVGREHVGDVLGVHATDGGDVIEIGREGSDEAWFIPAVKRWVQAIDASAGTVTLADDALADELDEAESDDGDE